MFGLDTSYAQFAYLYLHMCVYVYVCIYLQYLYFLDPGYGDGGTFGMYICYLKKVYVNELR